MQVQLWRDYKQFTGFLEEYWWGNYKQLNPITSLNVEIFEISFRVPWGLLRNSRFNDNIVVSNIKSIYNPEDRITWLQFVIYSLRGTKPAIFLSLDYLKPFTRSKHSGPRIEIPVRNWIVNVHLILFNPMHRRKISFHWDQQEMLTVDYYLSAPVRMVFIRTTLNLRFHSHGFHHRMDCYLIFHNGTE